MSGVRDPREHCCAFIYLMRACDMNACCILVTSESQEAAVRRSQEEIPTRAGVGSSCCLV